MMHVDAGSNCLLHLIQSANLGEDVLDSGCSSNFYIALILSHSWRCELNSVRIKLR